MHLYGLNETIISVIIHYSFLYSFASSSLRAARYANVFPYALRSPHRRNTCQPPSIEYIISVDLSSGGRIISAAWSVTDTEDATQTFVFVITTIIASAQTAKPTVISLATAISTYQTTKCYPRALVGFLITAIPRNTCEIDISQRSLLVNELAAALYGEAHRLISRERRRFRRTKPM